MKYNINLDKLEDQTDILLAYSQNNIKDKIEKLRVQVEDVAWEGDAHDAYIKGFNELVDEAETINANLLKIGLFLSQISQRYREEKAILNQTSLKEFSEGQDEMH